MQSSSQRHGAVLPPGYLQGAPPQNPSWAQARAVMQDLWAAAYEMEGRACSPPHAVTTMPRMFKPLMSPLIPTQHLPMWFCGSLASLSG